METILLKYGNLQFIRNGIQIIYVIIRTTRNCSEFIANYACEKTVFVTCFAISILTFYSDLTLITGGKDILFGIML